MILPIRVGDTITIKEADYCSGYGDVTLRIAELPPDHLPGGSAEAVERGGASMVLWLRTTDRF